MTAPRLRKPTAVCDLRCRHGAAGAAHLPTTFEEHERRNTLNPEAAGHLGISSVLSLAITSEPVRCWASFSSSGPTMRQGPHQGAQKSTRTGKGNGK